MPEYDVVVTTNGNYAKATLDGFVLTAAVIDGGVVKRFWFDGATLRMETPDISHEVAKALMLGLRLNSRVTKVELRPKKV